jgi:uncharacterized protein YqjF (DUF2071 family)
MSVASEGNAIRYRSRRQWPHDSSAITDIVVEPGEAWASTDLTERDHFLTARFRLYSMSRRGLHHADIEHPPWPLTRATVLQMRETLFEQAGLPPPQGAPLVHYSATLDVSIGPLDLH